MLGHAGLSCACCCPTLTWTVPAVPAMPAPQPDSASDATSFASDDWDDMLQPVEHSNKRRQQVWLIQQVGLAG